MCSLKLRTKAGRTFFIDFRHYTYLDYKFRGTIITPGSVFVCRSAENFTVDKILSDSIVLLDENCVKYCYAKETLEEGTDWEVLAG